MQTNKRTLILGALAALATLAALVSGGARAHTDERHPKATGPVKKEEKDWGIAGMAGKIAVLGK